MKMASVHRCLRGIAMMRHSTTGFVVVCPSKKYLKRPRHGGSTASYSNCRMQLRSENRNEMNGGGEILNDNEGDWCHLLPLEDWSHGSAKLHINNGNAFDRETFANRLNATITACREMEKSSLWVEVHMSKTSLIEEMAPFGFSFHHAQGETATLNLWLKESESMVPEFATHHVGVGGLVVNSRDEVLLVRELGKNYFPWKIPGGLSELGEQIDDAVKREVFEETGIRTVFRNILCFRHAHGLPLGRSDLYFVCQLDPVIEEDNNGNDIIPAPVPQPGEIQEAAWVPLSEFKAMANAENGHPMVRHILELYDRGHVIEKELVGSIVPGRKPSSMYGPALGGKEDTKTY